MRVLSFGEILKYKKIEPIIQFFIHICYSISGAFGKLN